MLNPRLFFLEVLLHLQWGSVSDPWGIPCVPSKSQLRKQAWGCAAHAADV